VLDQILLHLQPGARVLVACAFALSGIVAITHWAIRHQKLSPFGAWARFVRQWSDPVLRPVEQRVVRAGGNPQDAPLWLVGVTVVAGLIVIALVDWLVGLIVSIYLTAQNGQLLALVVHLVFELLRLAIMIRVIASWINPSPYSRFMRVIGALTNWMIEPIRRIIPSLGMIDISPMIAYFVLLFVEPTVMRLLF
jgi:YggT family protein